MEIPVIINEKVKPEELQSGGTLMSVAWAQLLPAINEIVRLRDDEVLDGFIVNENGLKIKLSRKKGRKNDTSNKKN